MEKVTAVEEYYALLEEAGIVEGLKSSKGRRAWKPLMEKLSTLHKRTASSLLACRAEVAALGHNPGPKAISGRKSSESTAGA